MKVLKELPEGYKKKYYEKFILPNNEFKQHLMSEDPTRFAYFMLGIKLRDYQAYALDQILINKKIAFPKARQIGFSTMVCVLALWAAFFNKYPSGISKNTKIGIISKEDDAAKKLLATIRDLLHQGDRHMSAFLKGKIEQTNGLFSRKLVEPNNTEQITFENRCIIKSYPPTAKVDGNSFDIAIIDEAHKLRCPEPERFYFYTYLPTLADTNGKEVLLSSPNGQGGFFADIVDYADRLPEEQKSHKVIGFHYSICREPNYVAYVEKMKDVMDEREFGEAFELSFMTAETSFFSTEKVDSCKDEKYIETNGLHYECTGGLDYGMTVSRCAIVVSTMINGIPVTIYRHRFPSDFDTNALIPFMDNLKERYNIVRWYVDDCPEGYTLNQQMLREGRPVTLFDFKKEKIRCYNAWKRMVNKGEWKVPASFTDLTQEMIELKAEENLYGNLSIFKPKGGYDDLCDATVMSLYPFLDLRREAKAYDI